MQTRNIVGSWAHSVDLHGDVCKTSSIFKYYDICETRVSVPQNLVHTRKLLGYDIFIVLDNKNYKDIAFKASVLIAEYCSSSSALLVF
jgi:hypothetical protein